jgi:hypothetical protein
MQYVGSRKKSLRAANSFSVSQEQRQGPHAHALSDEMLFSSLVLVEVTLALVVMNE